MTYSVLPNVPRLVASPLHLMTTSISNWANVFFKTMDIDLQSWSKAVFSDVAKPYLWAISYPAFYLQKSLHCTCHLSEQSGLSESASDIADAIKKHTFVIVLAFLHVDGNSVTSTGIPNHVASAFFGRRSVQDPWTMYYCDPNFPSTESGLTAKYAKDSRKIADNLYDQITEGDHMEYSQHGPIKRIEFFSCVNCNACATGVGQGICFTALCLNMLGIFYYCKIHGKQVNNGLEALRVLHEASNKIRSHADEFIRLMYSEKPDIGRIQSILR
jgi:hypothetical protein